ALTLPTEYGYVLLVGAAHGVPNCSGGQVGGARSKAKVPYPHMYATQAECADDKNNLSSTVTNALIRTFSKLSAVSVSACVAGIQYPVLPLLLVQRGSSVGCFTLSIPVRRCSKRNNGVAWIHLVALLTLIVLGISTGVSLSLAAFAS
ncbi:hypothetical protein BCR33DRAFT_712886, partial [Rhizoclosmatium globosum]